MDSNFFGILINARVGIFDWLTSPPPGVDRQSLKKVRNGDQLDKYAGTPKRINFFHWLPPSLSRRVNDAVDYLIGCRKKKGAIQSISLIWPEARLTRMNEIAFAFIILWVNWIF